MVLDQTSPFLNGDSNIMDRGILAISNSKWIFFFQTCTFLLHKTLIDGLESYGLLVDYCDVFISCLVSHSGGTHSLQRIDWCASNVMLNFSTSVHMKKQTHLHLGWPESEYIFT